MSTLTLEEILHEAFTASDYPATQQLYEPNIPAPSEMKVFGKISVTQANIFHWAHQLVAYYSKILNDAEDGNDLSSEQERIFTEIIQDIKLLRKIMWRLIHVDFPESTDDAFKRTVILPDWRIAAVYITEEDRRQQKFEQKTLQEILGIPIN